MKKLAILFPGKRTFPGRKNSRRWVLQEERVYTLGVIRKHDPAVIALPPARDVARRHARIFFRDGCWWLEALPGHATTVNRVPVNSGRAVVLKEYDLITIGRRTRLLVFFSEGDWILRGGICILPDIAGTLNYALLCSGLPFIRRITIYNCNNTSSRAFTLRLGLGGYFREEREVPALSPGESFPLKDFNLFPEVFSHPGEDLLFTLHLGDKEIYQRRVRKMSFDTWLKDPRPVTSASLAAFVLPQHSYVSRITDEVRDRYPQAESPGEVLDALYSYLKNRWHIRFNEEPFCLHYNSQKIRLPQHILYDWERKNGEGNCLDLALLFCACLENRGLRGVILLIEPGPELRHALVAVEPAHTPHGVPLVREKKDLPRGLRILDPNSLCAGLKISEAARRGEELLAAHPLLFALRIREAREYGIGPLPFTGSPRESPWVIELGVKARELAESINPAYRVCTTLHLLLAMLQAGPGLTERVFREEGIDPASAAAHFIRGLQNIEITRRLEKITFSRNFALIMPRATLLARETASLFIMEEHLLLALLEIPGDSLSIALRELGVDKDSLKKRLHGLLLSNPSPGEEYAKSMYNNKKKGKKGSLFFF